MFIVYPTHVVSWVCVHMCARVCTSEDNLSVSPPAPFVLFGDGVFHVLEFARLGWLRMEPRLLSQRPRAGIICSGPHLGSVDGTQVSCLQASTLLTDVKGKTGVH